MDKELKLISEQALEIMSLKIAIGHYKEGMNDIYNVLYCIGGPLNDNVRQYTKEQLIPFVQITNSLII